MIDEYVQITYTDMHTQWCQSLRDYIHTYLYNSQGHAYSADIIHILLQGALNLSHTALKIETRLRLFIQSYIQVAPRRQLCENPT